MSGRKIRFAAGVVIILGAILFFVFSGFQEGKAYYRTLDELDAMGAETGGKRLRVAGRVTDGSVQRQGSRLEFQLEQEKLRIDVVYTGTRPVPDTFKDGIDAVVEGYRRPDGTFEADQIQAKCASKYEAKYGSEN